MAFFLIKNSIHKKKKKRINKININFGYNIQTEIYATQEKKQKEAKIWKRFLVFHLWTD